jgi:hypothetical protein
MIYFHRIKIYSIIAEAIVNFKASGVVFKFPMKVVLHQKPKEYKGILEAARRLPPTIKSLDQLH